MMPGGRVLLRIAVTCLALGSLLLAFVAYQLWGTAYFEHHEQTLLRDRLLTTLDDKRLVVETGDPGGAAVVVIGHRGRSGLAGHPAPFAAPPKLGAPIGYIAIPRIGLDAVFVQGVGEQQLEEGPGHYPGTPLPGEPGNAAIAGHRTTYGAPFFNLNELKRGDPIFVLTSQGLFRYDVARSFTVVPTNPSVLEAARGPELTLTTCNPRYSATERLVVVAKLLERSGPPGLKKVLKTFGLGDAEGAVAGTNTRGDLLPVIAWGVAAVVLLVGIAVVWRRTRGAVRALLIPIAVIGELALILGCFQHVSTVLPPGY